MRKLIAILGLLGTLTGFAIKESDIIDIFDSDEYSDSAKEAVLEIVTEKMESIYDGLLNDPSYDPFGPHFCN